MYDIVTLSIFTFMMSSIYIRKIFLATIIQMVEKWMYSSIKFNTNGLQHKKWIICKINLTAIKKWWKSECVVQSSSVLKDYSIKNELFGKLILTAIKKMTEKWIYRSLQSSSILTITAIKNIYVRDVQNLTCTFVSQEFPFSTVRFEDFCYFLNGIKH